MLFLIYINDLFEDLPSKAKLFADNASLFSLRNDITTAANDVNNDLKKSSDCTFQWKISFIPGSCQQAQEVIFSTKLKNRVTLSLGLYNAHVL